MYVYFSPLVNTSIYIYTYILHIVNIYTIYVYINMYMHNMDIYVYTIYMCI